MTLLFRYSWVACFERNVFVCSSLYSQTIHHKADIHRLPIPQSSRVIHLSNRLNNHTHLNNLHHLNNKLQLQLLSSNQLLSRHMVVHQSHYQMGYVTSILNLSTIVNTVRLCNDVLILVYVFFIHVL